ncbi:MAG: DUF4126 domain-containing protein [Candidatus Tantalella remota]|nr:DUF4126 domain-containing protein [Candidatus Tantalella remota]
MDLLSNLGILLGGSWAAGINLYLTIVVLGMSDRLGWINLPGSLDVISHPLVILIAGLLLVIEFFADKIPYVDSAWDSIHTFIRPAGAAALAYMAIPQSNEVFQMSAAMLSGGIALDSHLTKATTRVAINTSPEPFTNSLASITEDSLVLVVIWLAVKHPVIATLAVISFLVFSIWFLKVMFVFLKKVFRSMPGNKEENRE